MASRTQLTVIRTVRPLRRVTALVIAIVMFGVTGVSDAGRKSGESRHGIVLSWNVHGSHESRPRHGEDDWWPDADEGSWRQFENDGLLLGRVEMRQDRADGLGLVLSRTNETGIIRNHGAPPGADRLEPSTGEGRMSRARSTVPSFDEHFTTDEGRESLRLYEGHAIWHSFRFSITRGLLGANWAYEQRLSTPVRISFRGVEVLNIGRGSVRARDEVPNIPRGSVRARGAELVFDNVFGSVPVVRLTPQGFKKGNQGDEPVPLEELLSGQEKR